MEFPFSAIEASLARRHGIRDDARTAFAARIKHLQRNGFPPGTNTGRGRAAAYTVEHLLMLSIAFELISLGINPERAADSVLRGWKAMGKHIQAALDGANRGAGTSLVAVTHFNSLADLMEKSDDYGVGVLFTIERKKLHEALARPSLRHRRYGVFNFTDAIVFPISYLADNTGADVTKLRALAQSE